jgi:hypothetical protein
MRSLILVVAWFGMGILVTALTVDALKVRASATRTEAGLRPPAAAPSMARTHRTVELMAFGRDVPDTSEQIRPKSR